MTTHSSTPATTTPPAIERLPRIHHLKLGRPALTLIAQGKQTVEGRLGSARMRAIRAGDVLCFNEGQLHCAVTRVTLYASFRDMVVAESPQALGEKPDDVEAAVKAYAKIYWYPGAQEKGAVAFAVQVIDQPPCGYPEQLCLW